MHSKKNHYFTSVELKQIKQKAVRDSMAYKAQNFRVANPLDFNARSGRF